MVKEADGNTQGIVNEGVGLVSYNPHFKGAITLLRMREEEQFSTSHGTEMFDFVMQVLVSKRATCWQRPIKSDVIFQRFEHGPARD